MDSNRLTAAQQLNKEIHRTIYPIFRKQHQFNNKLVDEFFLLLNKRLKKGQCFRPYYMKVMYEYIKQCMIDEGQNTSHLEETRMKQLLEIELPFFAEAIITIQYLDNHILDKKNGIKENNKALKKVMLSSNIMKDYLWEYINHIEFDDKKLECSTKKTLRKYIRRTFLYVDMGQAIELEWNRYDKLNSNEIFRDNPFEGELEEFIDFSPMQDVYDFLFEQFDKEYHNYLELYLKRIYLTTGSLFILLGELLIELMRYEGKEVDNIKNFTKCYGVLSQLVNDNCDVVPSNIGINTNAKIAQDAFSDLRNKNITLPLLFHIGDNQKNFVVDVLEDRITIKDCEEQIFNELRKRETIYKSIAIGKLLAKKAVTYINPKINQAKAISDILSIAKWNKFYFEIYKSINRVDKTKSGKTFRKQYLRLKNRIKEMAV